MKNLHDIISERYSCRSYADTPLSQAQIDTLLEAVRLAPSACNRQPWRLIAAGPDDTRVRNAIAAAYPRDWAVAAPFHFVVCAAVDEAWVRPADGVNHYLVDAAIATEHICLAATEMGLGTCWICNFNPARLIVDLHLPAGIVPVAIIPVGYPTPEAPHPDKKRKPLDEILIKIQP